MAPPTSVVLGTEVKWLEGEDDNQLEAVTEAHGADLMTAGSFLGPGGVPCLPYSPLLSRSPVIQCKYLSLSDPSHWKRCLVIPPLVYCSNS